MLMREVMELKGPEKLKNINTSSAPEFGSSYGITTNTPEDVPFYVRSIAERYPYGNVHMGLRFGPLIIENGVEKYASSASSLELVLTSSQHLRRRAHHDPQPAPAPSSSRPSVRRRLQLAHYGTRGAEAILPTPSTHHKALQGRHEANCGWRVFHFAR